MDNRLSKAENKKMTTEFYGKSKAPEDCKIKAEFQKKIYNDTVDDKVKQCSSKLFYLKQY